MNDIFIFVFGLYCIHKFFLWLDTIETIPNVFDMPQDYMG